METPTKEELIEEEDLVDEVLSHPDWAPFWGELHQRKCDRQTRLAAADWLIGRGAVRLGSFMMMVAEFETVPYSDPRYPDSKRHWFQALPWMTCWCPPLPPFGGWGVLPGRPNLGGSVPVHVTKWGLPPARTAMVMNRFRGTYQDIGMPMLTWWNEYYPHVVADPLVTIMTRVPIVEDRGQRGRYIVTDHVPVGNLHVLAEKRFNTLPHRFRPDFRRKLRAYR